MGTLVAWVLVRDQFPGKRILNSIIDLPFALPTIVASLALLGLYGTGSPVGINLSLTRTIVAVALLFVTLPFAVRSVQPVLLELDKDVEEAAASLGASNLTTFRRIVLPALRPAILSGTALSFARCMGEYGSIVLLATQSPDRQPRDLRRRRERDRLGQLGLPAGRRPIGGAARDRARRAVRPAQVGDRPWSLGPSGSTRCGRWRSPTWRCLLLAPVVFIFIKTFEHGFSTAWGYMTTPAAVSAFWLSVLIAAVAVPLNTIFGVGTAMVLVRSKTRGRKILDALIDIPFVVSPVIIGLSLVLVYGIHGWFGSWFIDRGIPIIFNPLGMILATVFVSLPFCVREVAPVLMEVGTEQEQAAATLGASSWQTFWRVTLPSIRTGVAYGVVLTTARALGEIGAVAVVSSNVLGSTISLPLLVKYRTQTLGTGRDHLRLRDRRRARRDVADRAVRDDPVGPPEEGSLMRIDAEAINKRFGDGLRRAR